MLPYRPDFENWWWLLALPVLLPVLWVASFRSLAGLGNIRRLLAISLRSAVLVMLVLALAELKLVRSSDRLTVIYLLDQSLSIPPDRREAMLAYVNLAILRHRRADDRVGVVVFGRDAQIEVPPFNDSIQLGKVESSPDPESTNLAGAIKLAQASFPEDAAKRIVIISDGQQNLGDATEQARLAAEGGIGIDVEPITYSARHEVLVEKLTIPSDVRLGEPFDLRVVLNNTTQPAPGESGVVAGKLVVTQRTDDEPVVLSEQPIELPPGKKVYTIRQQQVDRPQFYTYEARFVPDDPKADSMPENNQASTFTHVRGKGQVLLIEDQERPGEHGVLIDRLRREKLEVTVRPSSQLFNSLAELQQFDTVVLANVPRSSTGGTDDLNDAYVFSDEQIKMLAENTRSMGCGLVMLGGDSSFGAGGWTNTEIEKAMPVDFRIKSAKVTPKGALALLMHASEMADGNYWQKVIAKEAIRALGNEDYCGLLHWDGSDRWLWGGIIRVGGRRERMLGLVDRMFPGDMPFFDPGLIKAQQGFARLTDAAVKHMIIISDGDPSPPSARVVRGLKQAEITVSAVAVGCHGPAESSVMKNLAQATGGKYYEVLNPNALPRIFQREARRVAKPLIFEREQGFQPYIKFPHEMTSGIDGPLPPITGYVQTTVKKNPLVEVSIVSPVPPGEDNATIMASWTYGLGKTVAITTDAGARWAKSWPLWEGYDKLFGQAIRWSMRPAGEQGKFTMSTDADGGQVRVVVTALDKDDQFLNFLDLSGAVVAPNMKTNPLRLEQTAPGRYVGAFDTAEAGNYFVMLSPGAGKAPILSGVNVPYSAEFRSQPPDDALLTNLAAIRPKGGEPGKVIRDPAGGFDLDALLKTNTYRHDLAKATSSQDVWHYVLFVAGLTFFCDVFFRRVTVSLAWVPPMAARVRNRLLGREAPPAPTETLLRLRGKKAELSEKIEQQRAAARFEPEPEAEVDADVLTRELAGAAAGPPSRVRPSAGLSPQAAEETGYTSRLLNAKKQVQQQRDRERKRMQDDAN